MTGGVPGAVLAIGVHSLVCGLCLVPVRVGCCSGTGGGMFRYMPRAGYRCGEKRVDVWLSVAGHARLCVLADGWGCSLSDAVGRLVREEVGRGGVGVGAGGGGFAAADGGGSGPVAFGGRGDSGGVVAGHVSGALTGAAFLAALVQAAPTIGSDTSPGLVSEFFDPLQDIA